MQRFITTILILAALIVPALAIADGYFATVEEYKLVLAFAKRNHARIVKDCTPDSNDQADRTAVFKARSGTYNEHYPGSSVVCGDTISGTDVSGRQEWVYLDGKLIRMKDNQDTGLTKEYFQGGLVKVSDQTGDYVSYRVDLDSPQLSRFLDSKLPLQMNSSGAFIAGNGISFTQNELIKGLDQTFATMAKTGSDTMGQLAVSVLLDAKVREAVLKLEAKAPEKPAKTNPAELMDQVKAIADCDIGTMGQRVMLAEGVLSVQYSFGVDVKSTWKYPLVKLGSKRVRVEGAQVVFEHDGGIIILESGAIKLTSKKGIIFVRSEYDAVRLKALLVKLITQLNPPADKAKKVAKKSKKKTAAE